jgi:hypothetical protein
MQRVDPGPCGDRLRTEHSFPVAAIPARPAGTAPAVPVGSRQMGVIEIEEMMETFTAIVVAAVVVLLVVLGIIMVTVLIGFILSFL